MIKKFIPAFLAIVACGGVFVAIQSMLPPPASASGIVPAIVPALVPTANKTSTTSTVFALASSSALTASAPVCTNANGDMTTTACTANAVTSTTPVTVNANSTSDQQLMELSLTAGYLNSLGRPFNLFGAGVYTTQAAQTPTLEFKIKLCTVSGCGSGTVVTLADITSGATTAASSNVSWNVNVLSTTAATGAMGNLETHGVAHIDLGSLLSTASTSYNDIATAVSGNIDLTAALFVDFTITFSTNAVGANTCTQREGVVSPGGSTSGGGGGASIGPSADGYNSGTQTVSSNTTTQLTFNTNAWDTGSIHSTSVNPTRFTAPSTGFYLAQCTVAASTPSVDMFGNFLVNGVTPTPRVSNTTAAATNALAGSMTITGIAKLNANDYMECSVFSGAGFTSVANGSTMQLTKLSTTF